MMEHTLLNNTQEVEISSPTACVSMQIMSDDDICPADTASLCLKEDLDNDDDSDTFMDPGSPWNYYTPSADIQSKALSDLLEAT